MIKLGSIPSIFPLVSVIVLTYNHEKYVRECLDSILMQQCNFDFEIILGEDCSSDNTRKICIEYANKHPDKIRLFLRSRKDVIYINGQATGRYNFIACLKEVKGKYIALCEGDDYWTDPLKLQKQVDFLEANPEFAICFHKTKILEQDGTLKEDYITHIPKSESGIYDLAKGNYIHTPSVVFRNIITEFPDEFYKSPLGDYFLHMLMSQYGKIKCLEDIMAVYRNGVGIWSSETIEVREKKGIMTISLLMKYFSSRNKIIATEYLSRIFIFIESESRKKIQDAELELILSYSINEKEFPLLSFYENAMLVFRKQVEADFNENFSIDSLVKKRSLSFLLGVVFHKVMSYLK